MSFSARPSHYLTLLHPQISLFFFLLLPPPLVVADLPKPVLEPREASSSERALCTHGYALTVLLGAKSLEEPLPFRSRVCQAWSRGPEAWSVQLHRLHAGAERGRRKMGPGGQDMRNVGRPPSKSCYF